MKKNRKLKYRKLRITISLILSLAVLAGVFEFCNRSLGRSDSAEQYYSFFHEDTDYDAFIVGNSHAMNGVFPMQLWKDYGITSYNIAGHSFSIKASYHMLKLMTEYHKPKIVVIDVYGVVWGENDTSVSLSHRSFDALPLSPGKIEAAFDLFSDTSERLEFLFPFSVYHGRWSELSLEDMVSNFRVENRNYEKGAASRINVAVPAEYAEIAQDQKADPENATNMEMLEKTVEICLDNDLEVVLVNIPYPISEKKLLRANLIQDLADQYGIPYLNMFYYDLVDFDIDLCDENSHLNPSGATQVTEYLGNFLVENYDIEDKREKTEYQNWNRDYDEYYHKVLIKNLEAQKTFTNTLMLLNNNNFTANITFPENYSPNTVTSKQLERVNETVSYEMTDQNREFTIEIYDRESGDFLLKKVFDSEGKLVK